MSSQSSANPQRSGAESAIDAAAIAQAFDATWNTHDIEAVLAYFVDDGTIRLLPPPPPPTPGVYQGKEQLRMFVEAFMPGFQVQSTNYQGNGDRATWQWSVSAPPFRQMGADPATGTGELSLRGDKLESFTATLSDETLAKMQAAAQAAGEPI